MNVSPKMNPATSPLTKLAFMTILAAATAFPNLIEAAGAAPQPNVCQRGCWGARAPKSTAYMSGLNRAVIHHTASTGDYNVSNIEDSKVKVRAIQNFHMDVNGWSDIGYNFLVDKLGNTFEGRYGSMTSWAKGIHDGTNYNSFGFNVLGYYHPPYNQLATIASRSALYDVIAWRMPNGWSPYGAGSYAGKTVGFVAGHRNVKSTSCPGDGIYNHYITNDVHGGEARNGIDARIQGQTGNRVGMARSANGGGYWIAAADGGVFAFGNAPFYGSMGGQPLNSPVVGIAARPQGDGYWLVAADGGVFSFGAAPFHGSMGGQPLNEPIVGIASTANGQGYWLVAKDGGIFSFNAPFHGSLGGSGFKDIAAIATAFNSNGYWILRGDGSIYSYNATYHGGSGHHGRNDFIAIGARSNGGGYWLMTKNGNIYTHGAMNYKGGRNEAGYIGMAPGPSTYNGYWLLKNDGAIYSFGDALYHGGAN